MCENIHANNWLYVVLRNLSAPSANDFFLNVVKQMLTICCLKIFNIGLR